jgi:BlaI family transcriptional regulator, penicillinase repressor
MAMRRKPRSPDAPADDVLPEAEMEVLAVVHTRGAAGASEIREALQPFRPMTHASVLTLLGRLEAKGLVSRTKAEVGKAFVYRATAPKRVYGGLMRRIVKRIFADDPARLVATLFEARKPTKGELEQIRELVEKMERK